MPEARDLDPYLDHLRELPFGARSKKVRFVSSTSVEVRCLGLGYDEAGPTCSDEI